MTEAEVDDMMGKLMQNMAVVEEKIGLEQARQRRVRLCALCVCLCVVGVHFCFGLGMGHGVCFFLE